MKYFILNIFFLLFSFFSHSKTIEKNLIPTICSKFHNSTNRTCGGGATSSVNMTKDRKQCDDKTCHYFVYTAGHIVSGENVEVCLGARCYNIEAKDLLINGITDTAIIHLKIPQEEKFYPTFHTYQDLRNKWHISAQSSIGLGTISKTSKQFGHHEVKFDNDVIFERVTLMGAEADQELKLIEKHNRFHAPYIPLRKELKSENLDAQASIANINNLAKRIPLKTLLYSKRQISTAHLGPGNSGSPMITYHETQTMFDSLGGVFNSYNYRMRQSIISPENSIESLLPLFLKGKRGNLNNYQNSEVKFVYDPLTQSTYRTLLDQTIHENSHFIATDYHLSGGGDGANTGGGDGANTGGGDGANTGGGENKSKSSKTLSSLRDYHDIKPGMTYKNKHIIGFNIKHSKIDLNLYANFEALIAIEEISKQKKLKISPIKFNNTLNFVKLFIDKTLNGKNKKYSKTVCSKNDCINITYNSTRKEVLIQHIADNKQETNIQIKIDGTTIVKNSKDQVISSSYFFRPWVTIPTKSGSIQIDIRNLFFTDMMTILQDKKQTQFQSLINQSQALIILSTVKKSEAIGEAPRTLIFE